MPRKPHRKPHRSPWLILLIILPVCLLAPKAMALEPDEIALIVNSNIPESRQLADFYAQARHIPDNRILEIALPPAEEIPFNDYQQLVVPAVHDFLKSGNLTDKIKCFVTFYGVPLRIAGRINTRDENREQELLRQLALQVANQIVGPVSQLELLAQQLSTTFKPPATENDFDSLVRRAGAADKEILTQLPTIPDPQRQLQLTTQYHDQLQILVGDPARIQMQGITLAHTAATNPTQKPDTTDLDSAKADFQKQVTTASQLERDPTSATSREQLRQLVSKHFGLISYFRLLHDQIQFFQTADTASAFDSELPLAIRSVYPRPRWINNPLYYAAPPAPRQPFYMVMRLDAPKPQIVQQIITDSIKVESTGLNGQVVIDSRGMPPDQPNPTDRRMAVWDQYLRDLASLLKAHTKLKIFADDNPDVLPPNSATDVALYCGWYSLRKYIPSCKFNPGAVGYHIASYELVSLHGAGETGWVAGLLNDGVAATLGAVAEPYLENFPRPDDFFPLLLTGKLTLAETYWKTIPTCSWMITAIGDPLYNPYKANPQLQVDDLPDRLKPIFSTEVPAH